MGVAIEVLDFEVLFIWIDCVGMVGSLWRELQGCCIIDFVLIVLLRL